MVFWMLILVAVVSVLPLSSGSLGDASPVYRNCLLRCQQQNCSSEKSLAQFRTSQSLILKLSIWDCESECRYGCMWTAVELFSIKGRPIPQFHGKWPFIRILGLQEPASVLFSLLNLVGFLHLFRQLRLRLSPSCPMRNVWMSYSLLGIVTWCCSAVFHARDTNVTEKLDYFCAFASVLFGFYACLLRVSELALEKVSTASVALSTSFVAFFCYHIGYLSLYRFDYGYNMKANVTVGLLNSLVWLLWVWREWRRRRSGLWPCVVVIVLANLAVLLELGDFPPIFRLFDAHSVWHLCTAPLPFLWAKFVVLDCQYLLKKKHL